MNNDEAMLNECGIIMHIPLNAYKVEIIASYMNNDGEICTAKKIMNPEDIYNARKDYDENYVDPDAVYVLTDKAREELELECI